MTDVSTNTGLALFGATFYLCLYWQQVARPICQYGNATIEKLMKSCPTLGNLYWPPPHCWNPHLQFVPFVLRGMIDKAFPPFRRVREQVVLDDGELLAVDWFSWPKMESNGLKADNDDDTPILVLHHGAMCDSTDIPGQDYIAPALQRGWLVCVLNRRGHADMLRKPKWNFFGCVQDVRCVTESIKSRRPKAKLLTIGLSSGTALVATIFGYGDDVNHFDAGVGVCPGYSIERCMARFGSPYMEFLLWRGKEFFLKANAALLKHLPGYKECLAATNLQEWLNCAYAMAGCESLDAYFQQYNPVYHIGKATKPVMCINSENDPLCVVQNYHDEVHRVMAHNGCVGAVLTKTGSHLPFYEGLFMNNWAERVAFEFLDAFLASERDKKTRTLR